MKKRLSKIKAKAYSAFRPSADSFLSADHEPATADALGAGGGESVQASPAHASTTQGLVASIPNSQTRATEDPVAQKAVLRDPSVDISITQAQSAQESVAPQPWDVSIRDLWDVSVLTATFTMTFC